MRTNVTIIAIMNKIMKVTCGSISGIGTCSGKVKIIGSSTVNVGMASIRLERFGLNSVNKSLVITSRAMEEIKSINSNAMFSEL